METKKDLTVDGNITLTGAINSDTLTDTKLVFAGSSPSIYPGTTNTGISLNANGTGAISIGNSSTGDIYIGGGSTSGTRCLITNSSGNINCTGDITGGGNLTANGGYLKTSSTTGYLFNDTVTTLNIGKAATTLSIGASTGTTTINNAETVTGALTGSSTLSIIGGTTLSSTLSVTGAVTLTTALTVANGGTGDTTLTSNGVLYGQGTAAIAATTAGTSGQLLVANSSSVPTFVTLSSDATISSTGALTLASTGVTAASYGSTTAIPVLTVDAKGRITSASTASISSAWSSITNPSANLSLSMAANTSTFSYSATTGTEFSFSPTDSASSGTTTVNAIGIALSGTANATGGNTINAINLSNVTAATNNTFNALNFGTGYTNFITSGTVNLTAAGALSGITTLSLGGNLTFSTDNTYNIGASGANRPQFIYPGKQILNVSGSGALPSYAFSADNSSGMYYDSVNGGPAFATGGVERWFVANAGHLQTLADNTYDIGASGANRPRNIYLGSNIYLPQSPGAYQGIKMNGNTVMAYDINNNIFFQPAVSGGSIYINSFNNTLNLFHITDTGDTFFHHLTTTAAAANAVVDATTGNLQRSTSSLRYKNLLGYLDLPGAQNIVLNAKPIVYTSKSKADNPNTIYVGFAAEQIATTDARFVTFDEQGLPNWVQYPSFTAPLTLVAQNHEKRILNLETETNNLLLTVGLPTPTPSPSPSPTPTPTPTLAPIPNSILSRLNILEKSVLASSSASFDTLTVLKRLTTTDLGLTGKITQGLLSINGLDSTVASGSATINTISNDLYLQNLGVGGVNFLNGKVLIDKNGNLTVQKLNVSSNSAGSTVIPAGTISITVSTNALTPQSLIFVTPVIPVAVGASQSAATTISITLKDPLTQNLKVNWWIVN